MTHWHQFSLADQHGSLVNRDAEVAELVEYYLDRVARINPDVNALVHIDAEGARQRAERVGEGQLDLNMSGLAGLPSADKDLVAREGMPTGYGSVTTRGQPVAEASEPMAQWLDAVGVLSMGKRRRRSLGCLLAQNPPQRARPATLTISPGQPEAQAAERRQLLLPA